MPRSSTRIGTSGGTPIGAPVPLQSVKGKTRCLLFGPGIIRDTTIFVRENLLQQRRHEYALLGQQLIIPKQALDAEIKRIGRQNFGDSSVKSAESMPEPTAKCFVPHSHARPIICLRTGRFYASADEAGRKNKMTGQAVSYQLKKNDKSPKPPTFRYATDEEIQCAMTIPGWKVDLSKP